MSADRKILLLGKNGQLGWELQRALAPLGTLIALDRHSSEACGDLADLDGLAATVAALRPEAIVNAGAYTAVDKAESDVDTARRINAEAPAALAHAARACGAWLIHYSTDYVFDGSGRDFRDEDAPTGPLNVYGQTKLDGEHAIRASGARHLILRTSWVHAARGGNFARTMLKLAAERERLTVVDDQFGAPTGADLLADLSAHMLREALQRPADADTLSGVFHAVAAGQTSWHAYANHVIDWARRHGQTLAVREIAPVPASTFPTPARRPHNSRLSTGRLQRVFGLTPPPWQAGVDRMLAEVLTPR
ncbi:dTDP-4-dehydrorhamnose reductase [Sphaerotilus mobilis]|uniref:dTDP-4-dehydrorhamnose reductase n=1 Tax=Sphaerotilus mobilis TaxID=47994 RepID=A0A4Q7LBD8_9BURK|nr:dTDP-4-dehydrorhamnose reductase [Sphaerotilus mobilis]RZS47465.1 dTDP-4-dehydrorhamnose reductase [Sphaerotilus mobilis]